MKPLEPGCLALIKLPPAMGVPVHEVTCVGPLIQTAPGHTVWMIESPIKHAAILTCSCCLTRIDGGDPDAVETKDKELTV